MVYFQVVVTYPNKQPAANVPVVISAKGRKDGKEQELRKFKDKNSGDKTDEKGEAEFVVDACSKCDAILIQVCLDAQIKIHVECHSFVIVSFNMV